jgi:hypothetical protein
VLLGGAASAGGTLAVFVKNNGTGAGVLLVVGFAFLLMAVTGRAITSVKLPGGGQVDLETVQLGEQAKQIAQADDPIRAQELTEKLIADAGVVAKVPDPEAKARQVTAVWVELSRFVDDVAQDLSSKGVTYRFVSGERVPRIVATVDGTDYGLYIMASTQQSPRWVDWSVAASQKLTPTVKPVLVLEDPPISDVQAAANRQNVAVMWRAGNQLSPAPWDKDGDGTAPGQAQEGAT